MSIAACPFALSFQPAPSLLGSPVFADRTDPTRCKLAFSLTSNPSGPSSAMVLRSIGLDLGVPRDARNLPLRTRSPLSVAPRFDFDSFFFTRSVFGSALVSASLHTFIVEFDTAGRLTQSFELGQSTVLRDDRFRFFGSDGFSPGGHGFVVLSALGATAAPGFFHRAWLDLRGEIRAAGFGGIGGSASIAQVFVRFLDVSWSFTPIA